MASPHRATPLRLLAAVVGGIAFLAHFLAFRPSADFEAERQVAVGFAMTAMFLARFAVVLAVCYALVWLAMLAFSDRSAWSALRQPRQWSGLAWVALALFMLALAPYWLADRKPTISGWSVRFLFTMGPALALACIAWTRQQTGTKAPVARLLPVLMAALLLSYIARWPFWLERVVKDDAVVAFARTASWPAQPQTVCIHDQNPTVARPYRSIEWTGMVQWGSARSDVLALQPASFTQLEQELADAARMLAQRFPLVTAPVPGRCTQEVLVPEPRADWPVTVVLALARRSWMASGNYDAWLLSRYPVSGRAAR
jgi:hypothetical protein